MSCTTILIGKKASHDGSTMIARNDDGHFDVKKLIVVSPEKQPKKYKSKIGHLEIELPEKALRYTATPNVDKKDGIWAAGGINEANVGMTATETITTNPRVLGADPLVEYKKAEKRGEKDVPGGIGEEDLVVLVLPYIKSAREGVLRLGSLLEKYGTYESNGIAFNDENEIWWLETIGGHHWIARRVGDEEVVIMPNQFGLDRFDFDDAYGKGKNNLCSKDLKEFMEKNFLNTGKGEDFNPREAFGSHDDGDHVYNTPRAWFMARYFMPNSYIWDGECADFGPESDDIPWAFEPEKKVTPEDVKYILSSYFQGTPYNPYSASAEKKGIYRSIGINRTSVMCILQIRGYMKEEALKSVQWLCFGSNAFNAALPLYSNVSKMPKYFSGTTMEVSTDSLYWSNRLIEVIADAKFGDCTQHIERYQEKIPSKGRELIAKYDAKAAEAAKTAGKGKASGKGAGGAAAIEKILEEANEELAKMSKKETIYTLGKVLETAGPKMKNGYSRSDN